jgi:hypothetical protein
MNKAQKLLNLLREESEDDLKKKYNNYRSRLKTNPYTRDNIDDYETWKKKHLARLNHVSDVAKSTHEPAYDQYGKSSHED